MEIFADLHYIKANSLHIILVPPPVNSPIVLRRAEKTP